MGLYQLKKPKDPSIAYFSAWDDHGNLVRGDPALKKGYKNEWFVAESKWWIKTLGDDDNLVEVLNSFSEDCEYLPYIYFSFFNVILRLNILFNLGFSMVSQA